MRNILLVLFLLSFLHLPAQDKYRNLFLITIDGFRWQELFSGADSLLIRDTTIVGDTSLLLQQFWHADITERRKKLLPFFWNVIAERGSISGNRNYGNKVNAANPFLISYAGYNEMLTGYADTRFIPNLAIINRNSNVLEFLNQQKGYTGKVAAFSSWNILPYILREKQSKLPVNSGYELLLDAESDTVADLINQVQSNVSHKGATRYDLLTFASAKNFIEENHPKVLFLGMGETDEFAHQKRYDQYLLKAHQFDQLLSELWYYVQTNSFYKNNTTFIITTDHGRGRKTTSWNKHGFWVGGSKETWMAMMGPDVNALGEKKNQSTTFLKQVASTVADLLGGKFTANHPVGEPMDVTGEIVPPSLAIKASFKVVTKNDK